MASTLAQATTRPYQIVVWGATGFTGRLVAEHLARDYQGKVKWAIAGRNQQKLEEVRAELVKINDSCKDIPILIADAHDAPGVAKVLSQTKVVLSTAGPYALYGDTVVEQSIASGTHYCDLTGEVCWVKRSGEKHHKEALEKKVKIVHCCGFDSIPSDIGALMCVDHIKNKLGKKTSKVYGLMADGKGGFSGGTVYSGLNMLEMEDKEDIGQARSNAYYLANVHNKKSGSDHVAPFAPTFIPPADSWAAPFIMEGVNARVVHLSNALAKESYGSDFSYLEMTKTSKGMAGWFGATMMTAIMGLLGICFVVPPLKYLLKKMLPAPGQGPSLQMQRTGFWSFEYYAETEEEAGVAPTVVKAIAGDRRDPGYWSTSRMLLETGLALALDDTVVEQTQSLPGGVLTPATAVGMHMVTRLRAAGFTFEVVDK